MSLVPGGCLGAPGQVAGRKKGLCLSGANDCAGHDHCPGYHPHLPAPCPLSDANSYSKPLLAPPNFP